MMRWIGLLVLALLLASACEEQDSEGPPTASPEPDATATAMAQFETPAGADTITVGDTVTGVPEGFSPGPLSLTLLACLESGIAVNGPYSGGDYYTFTAKPGMRFVMLQYRLANNGVRQYDTPFIDAGEVQTAPNGYFYRVWSPPLGVLSEEYAPRPATQAELDALWGEAGAYKTLLPGESVTGRVVFEIPADAEPVNADLAYVPSKIDLEGRCR